ncbi:MAG: P1 family peptidase [Chloroflexota bacterium]|nr:P1 family peptidase [Chloroflexota bacterium]
MRDAITDVLGIGVGHAQDRAVLTGCTVVLCEDGAVAGVDVRGGAPGTRETDLCRPGTLVEQVHAVLLTGGSAFGLDAATGVMRFLRERGVGFDTGVAKVPIVPAAVIFDLGIGAAGWPDADMGYTACASVSTGEVARGCAGAGAGATVGKLLGYERAMKSGLGTASTRVGDATVGALVVVNALGDVVDPETNEVVAGTRGLESGRRADVLALVTGAPARLAGLGLNTTIGVVATDAVLTDAQASHLASAAHDGLARTVRPAHTLHDGDTLFALATGKARSDKGPDMLALAVAAVRVVERAVLDAVRSAQPAGGLPVAGG